MATGMMYLYTVLGFTVRTVSCDAEYCQAALHCGTILYPTVS